MASITDIYNAMVTLTQSLNYLTTSLIGQGGNFTAINNLSSAAFVNVLPISQTRKTISFHNPGVSSIFVAPTTLGPNSSIQFSPTNTQLGGTIEIFPGGWITLSGAVRQAWQALASNQSSQPMTILDQ